MGIPERKQREKLLRQTQILDAAYQVFRDVGFLAATMDQIAERAELAKGTIYIYFKSKEELYFSLLAKGLDILIELLSEKVRANPPPDAVLREIADAFYTYYRDYTDYFRIFMIMQQEDMHAKLSPELFKEINARVLAILRLVRGEIQKLLEHERALQVDSRLLTDILWGAFIGITQVALVREKLNVKRRNVEDLLLLCYELICKGIRTDGGRQKGKTARSEEKKPHSERR
jgi:AcrR family transcriptional regulator